MELPISAVAAAMGIVAIRAINEDKLHYVVVKTKFDHDKVFASVMGGEPQFWVLHTKEKDDTGTGTKESESVGSNDPSTGVEGGTLV